METKYYTPEIEEFHVGFEYEQLHESGKMLSSMPQKKEWVKCIISVDDFLDESIANIQNGLEHFDEPRIRVKYLDQEDIESLGGLPDTHHGVLAWVFWVGKIDFYLFWSPNSTVVSIKNSGDQQVFRGMVKNKSRLLLLLKMIGIKLDVA